MRNFRFAFLAFIAVSAVAAVSYFLSMHAGGSARISSNTQDWGGFGSYIGGILAPAASLLAGYMVYKSFASNAYQQKLLLARESLSRLDVELEKKLQTPFNNICFGDEYYGRPLRDVVDALSNNVITTTEVSSKLILSLLHNIAILANSIRYYIGLLGGLPSAEKDNHWLGELEKIYWIEKYSAVCSRMVRIVGQSAFENKVSTEQLRSFKLILGGEYGL
ncbi:hypothetical protein [Pseudomonas frederiksbergensis]|uniref:DUF4760 domain-containing protein n=1 Tax=Pseudomonas frederiksbergensis TaxID=104087 RepID=A0A6L5C295_9PSED|nr:hypothetical protein [Pseudomonas frederiksbergensis]KAF2394272.1 hypothetical protein FX983_02253 [Pseudomonas frederiksbergensis]